MSASTPSTCPPPTVDLGQLAKDCRGRVAFWIDLGVDGCRPAATHEDVREEVRRVRKLLDFGSGIIARCRWAPGTPLRNVAAFFEEWMIAASRGRVSGGGARDWGLGIRDGKEKDKG